MAKTSRPSVTSDEDQIDLFTAPPAGLQEGRERRDAVLDDFEVRKEQVLAELRREAWRLWYTTHEPVTVNAVRHILDRLGYEGDPRLLGAVFHRSEWVPVAHTQTDVARSHARPIRAFIPKEL